MKQYLHLSAYSCGECAGPVISGSIAVRENEISKETNKREVGAICLACGHRPSKGTEPGLVHDFPPTLWASANGKRANSGTIAESETLRRAEIVTQS
jgi:hypothetical protein